ncbi:hypothetical protein LO80_01320 [Candidatus Francisella endociliophora]|uniref:Glycosyltransferase RgtA/B/C/D-like domain-containing protein n=1 Tax=Candidatus Francisella endociliophora TaxID=653937 RepID=A0A097EMF3_9GAMM|nr:glycosyltransferase family 39 protein [Francisella sp. FSC1006]AIT08745.1 hypothetical protein LO80_01320 [Francisella sp. FSC1006]
MNRKISIIFIIGVVLLYLCFLGAAPLFDRDEGYYISVAINMLDKHSLFIPYYNNSIWLEKPVLLYWMMQATTAILGESVFAFRLPIACCGILMITSMYFLLNTILKDRKNSFIITATAAFMPLFVYISRSAMIDTPLTFFIALSLLFFFIATEKDKLNDRKWYYFSWLFLGLSFFAKGPVGPAIVLPSMFVYLILQRDFWRVFKRANIPVGVIIFCLTNFWYFVAFWKLGDVFWNKFFVEQVFDRGATSLVGWTAIFTHFSAFYIIVILLTTVPFVGAIVAGFLLSFKGGFKPREQMFDKLAIFASIFTIITLFVFSFSATKLPHYVLPVYPFLAILVGYFWSNVKSSLNVPYKKTFWTLFSAPVLLLSIAGVLVPILSYVLWGSIEGILSKGTHANEYTLPNTLPISSIVIFSLAIIGIVTLIAFIRAYKKKAVDKMITISIISGFCYSFAFAVIFIVINSWLQNPALEMAKELRVNINNNSKVVEVGIAKPSLYYYIGIDYMEPDSEVIDRKKSIKGLLYLSAENISNNKQPLYILTRNGDAIKYDHKNLFVIKKYPPYLIIGNKVAKETWQ